MSTVKQVLLYFYEHNLSFSNVLLILLSDEEFSTEPIVTDLKTKSAWTTLSCHRQGRTPKTSCVRVCSCSKEGMASLTIAHSVARRYIEVCPELTRKSEIDLNFLLHYRSLQFFLVSFSIHSIYFLLLISVFITTSSYSQSFLTD